MKKLMFVAVAAALAGGCKMVRVNDGGDSDRAPAVCKDAVHEKYTVAEKPITVSQTVEHVLKIITWGTTADHIADYVKSPAMFGPAAKARNAAYAKACSESGADAIVGAKYKISAEDYIVYGKVTCEITGYPAKMTGVEIVTPKCCCEIQR